MFRDLPLSDPSMSPPSGGFDEQRAEEGGSVVRSGTDLGLTPPGYVLPPPFGGS